MLNHNFYFFPSIGCKLFAPLSLTSAFCIYILTEAQLWHLLGCFTASSFLHIPKFPTSVSYVSQGLLMGTHVLCFYCLMEVLQPSAFLLLALILAALSWYQFSTTSSPGRGSSNSRHSSHKGEAGGDCLFPVGWCFHAGPCRSGCATCLVSRVLGEDMGFPHCCVFPLALKQLERRSSAAWWSDAHCLLVLSWVRERELMEKVLKLTSNPLLGEIQMGAQLICACTSRLHSNMHQALRANCIQLALFISCSDLQIWEVSIQASGCMCNNRGSCSKGQQFPERFHTVLKICKKRKPEEKHVLYLPFFPFSPCLFPS